ncbi:MAG TPA: adenosylcobinamide-phosphate synthase CbiB [Candidatus Binataceae bacterium]|nr:adenosylcobinamide-phosphate synthase CbiB [Candidatus Binataceae bacterium]
MARARAKPAVSHAFHLPVALVAGALALDLAFGDPRWMPHPVRAIGMLAERGERLLRTGDPNRDFARGAILAAGMIALSVIAAWAIVALADWIHPIAGALAAVIIAWTTLALRGLDSAAGAVEDALAAGDDAAARRALPALVGRDIAALDRAAMAQACVESVAENASDAVVAPLLFLFVGGPAAAIAYKAINTLDSMIGYRDERYLYFGRAAARLDDVANFIPARLTAVCIAIAAQLTSGRGSAAIAAIRADARSHASPNAGYPEAAMAGAMGVRLGGDAIYGGKLEPRAILGSAGRESNGEDIGAARKLLRFAALIAFLMLAAARSMLQIL